MTYEPDCKTDSRVFINGERLPATTVDLHIRKEGALGVGRYVEGGFVSPRVNSEGEEEDYLQHFNTHQEDSQSDWDRLRVDILDRATDEYHCEFHGMVTGLGNSSGMEKEWVFRARGPGLFLDRISASKIFRNPKISDVFGYIDNRLEEKFPISISTMGTDGFVEPAKLGPFLDLFFEEEDFDERGSKGQKTFKSNQHTLGNVIEWFRDKSGMRAWFEPTQNGATLLGATKPSANTHEAHYDGGDLRVLDNNALVELRPVNTLILKSEVTDSLGPNGIFEIKQIKTGNEYNSIKIREPQLYERAGQTEYIAQPDMLSDARTMEGLRNEAKSLLKEEIDQTTGGNMNVLLRSPIRPFDVVKARPTCNRSHATDTEPVSYEVSRVHHQIKSGISKTKLNVSLHTPLERIETVSEATEAV